MKHQIKITILCAITFGFVFFSLSAQAASIDWGTGAQTVTGDTDVSLAGTLVDAFNLGDSSVSAVTVNGVTFQPFAFPADNTTNTVTLGNYTFTENQNFLASYNNLASGIAPFSALSSGYQTLLSSAGSAAFQNTMTLTISGLTIGQEYQFQFWTSNSSMAISLNDGDRLSTQASAGNTVSLLDNTAETNGGLGQFAIGTFTATGSTQLIDFTGADASNDPAINAFQLSIVPEAPINFLLIVGIVVGALTRVWRFRRGA